jgi:hypothetical protein
VIVAITGATAALAGLVLVFLGTLLAAYQAIPGEQSWTRTRGRLRTASRAALGGFVLSLVGLTLDVAWLLSAGGDCFFRACVVLFFVQVGALIAGGVWMTLGVLLRG